ncbi:hypothetical protein AcV5_001612 [Taiwanofungus camphoratus]|nr:hypothetical protein AcV5_001612 [Antrodia cinnamomea]
MDNMGQTTKISGTLYDYFLAMNEPDSTQLLTELPASVAPPARPQKEGRDGITLACEPPVDRREWHEYQGTDKSICRNAVHSVGCRGHISIPTIDETTDIRAKSAFRDDDEGCVRDEGQVRGTECITLCSAVGKQGPERECFGQAQDVWCKVFVQSILSLLVHLKTVGIYVHGRALGDERLCRTETRKLVIRITE